MRYVGLAPFLDSHTLLVRPQGKEKKPIVLQHLIPKQDFSLWCWEGKLFHVMW